MLPVFIVGIIFSVPVVAILSFTYLKAKKLQAEQFLSSGQQKEFAALLQKLSKENTELKTRIENLESIVSAPEWNLPPLNAPLKEAAISAEERELIKMLREKK